MFDKYYTDPTSIYNHTNITEIRVPTDESVKLLAEFEKAARDKVTKSYYIESNQFKCLVQIWDKFTNATKVIAILYELNNNRYIIQREFPTYMSLEEMKHKIFKDLSEDITCRVFSHIDFLKGLEL